MNHSADFNAPEPPQDTGFTGDAELGRRIRAQRKSLGITQEELALRVGVTQGTITFWETGRNSLTIANLRNVAKELGTEPGALLLPTGTGGLPNARLNESRLAEILQGLAGSEPRAFLNLPPKKQARLIAYLYSAELLPSRSELRSLIALATDA